MYTFIDCAALFPASMAFMTDAAPLTTSPPAKIPLVASRVSWLTVIVLFFSAILMFLAVFAAAIVLGMCSVAIMTVSAL